MESPRLTENIPENQPLGHYWGSARDRNFSLGSNWAEFQPDNAETDDGVDGMDIVDMVPQAATM